MAQTYESLMAKSRELYAAGDVEGAKRLARIALERKGSAPAEQFGPPTAQPDESVQDGVTVDDFLLRQREAETFDPGKVGAFFGGAADAGSFGLFDEGAAAIMSARPDLTYDQALAIMRGRMDATRDKQGGAMLAGQIGGSLIGPAATIKAAQGAGMAGRIGASALTGAVQGGAYGAGSGEGMADRAANAGAGAIIGGGIGAAIPAIGATAQRIADNRATKRAIAEAVRGAPTSDQLKAAGRAGYKAVADAGVSVKPDRVQTVMDDIATSLSSEGVALDAAGRLFPGANAILGATETAAAGKNTIPFNELDIFRRFTGNAAGANPANRADSRLAMMAKDKIDDFVMGLGPGDVDAGDVAALQDALPKAREIWARMSKSQMLDDAIDAGGNYLSGAASGIRNQFSRIIKNPKLAAGFSKPEIAAMRRVAQGTLPEQIVHILGGGLGKLTATAGGAIGGGIGGAAAGMAAGGMLSRASEKIVRKNAEIARALVASGKATGPIAASPEVRRIAEALAMRATRPSIPMLAPQLSGLLAPQ